MGYRDTDREAINSKLQKEKNTKNPPSNAGDAGSIPGKGTKIPHAAGQLSRCTTATEPMRPGAHVPQLESL